MKHKDITLIVLKKWQRILKFHIPFTASFEIVSWSRKGNFGCGTSYGAVGFLANQPEFNKLGLMLTLQGSPSFQGQVSTEAVMRFFHINHSQFKYLFHVDSYIKPRDLYHLGERKTKLVTLQMVIDRVEEQSNETS